MLRRFIDRLLYGAPVEECYRRAAEDWNKEEP
jgi:hypothetical protein